MDETALREVYAEYSAQDLDRLLGRLSDDVDWPDGPRRMTGKDAVKAYWTDQWRRTRTTDAPSRMTRLADDVVVARIDQTVRSVDGEVLSRGVFAHVLHLADDRVRRLDIVPLGVVGDAPETGADLEGAARG